MDKMNTFYELGDLISKMANNIVEIDGWTFYAYIDKKGKAYVPYGTNDVEIYEADEYRKVGT